MSVVGVNEAPSATVNVEFAAFAFMFIEPAVIADSEPIVRLPPEKLNALLPTFKLPFIVKLPVDIV